MKEKPSKVNYFIKAKDNFLLVKFISGIIFQCLFFLYYLYLIIANRDYLFGVIAYSVLLGLSLVLFIIDLVYRRKNPEDDKDTLRHKKRSKKKITFYLNLVKYLVKIITNVFAIYVMTIQGPTFFSVTLNILAWIIVIIQIIFALIARMIELQVNSVVDLYVESKKKREGKRIEEKK